MVLLELRGTQAGAVYTEVLCSVPTGKSVRLGKWKLPCKVSHEYLGIIISFRGLEEATFQHRKTKAVQTFNRVLHVLRSRRALSDNMRTRLWRCLVWPVLSYGLVATGLPDIVQACTSYGRSV